MRQWRVGTISMGFLLISLGLILLGNTFWDISISEVIVYGWPVILILLGVEVLLFSFFKKDGPLRFDFFSIFILIIAIMFTFVVYSVQESGILSAVRSLINDEAYTVEVNRNLNIPESIEEIIIEAPNGDFNIIGSDTNSADIKGTIRIGAASKEEAEKSLEEIFIVKTMGNQAIIRVELLNSKIGWFGKNGLDADLNITIPKSKFVKTKLINGDIKLKNMENSGKVEGVNGEIRLENNKGDFEVKTVNGGLSIASAKGNLNAKTINGEIIIKDVEGDLNAETTNGEIEVVSDSVLGDWNINTINGEINLEIPSETDAKIIGKASIGKVRGNVPWVGDDNDKLGSNKEVILGKSTYTIELKSQHGEIEVNAK